MLDDQIKALISEHLLELRAKVDQLRDSLEAIAATDAVSSLREVQGWVLHAGREVGGAGPLLDLALERLEKPAKKPIVYATETYCPQTEDHQHRFRPISTRTERNTEIRTCNWCEYQEESPL